MTNLSGYSIDRYHILEQLGQGGMATVYKAYDTRLEREVAIKIIRTELFGQAVMSVFSNGLNVRLSRWRGCLVLQ